MKADAKWAEVRAGQIAAWSPEISLYAGIGYHLLPGGANPLFAAQTGYNSLLVQLDREDVEHGLQPLSPSTRDNMDWQAGATIELPSLIPWLQGARTLCS